jgi:autotransporter-associated beta strand protein
MKSTFNPFLRRLALAASFTFVTAAPEISALTIDWSATAADTVWATGANWDGGTAPAAADTARFNKTSYTSQPDYGTVTIAGLTFGDGTTATAASVLSGTTLTLNGDIVANANAAAATINGANRIRWASKNATNNSANELTIGAGLTSQGTGGVTTFTFNGSGKVLVSGPIGNGGGTNDVALTKSAAGTLTLAGNNTFTGGVTLSGASTNSQLNLNSATALGAATSRLTIQGGDNAKIDNTSGAAVTIANNNPQTWNSNFSFVGSNDLNMGTGAITLGGSRAVLSSAKTLTLGGVVSGAGYSFTKQGAGAITLTGRNTYSGGTIITNGTLNLNHTATANPAVLGNVSLTTSSSARPVLSFLANNQLESTATISTTLGGSNSIFADVVLGGTSQTIANFAPSGAPGSTGRTILGNRATGDLGGGNGVLTINNASTVNLGSSTARLEIRDGGSGTLKIVKEGAGTLVFNLTGPTVAANAYTGGFQMKAGLTQVAGPAFGPSTPLFLDGGALSSSSGTARTFAAGNTVSLGGDVTLGDAVNSGKLTFPGAATLTANRILTINSDVEFSGGTGDGGGARSLTKTGTGRLILGGTNTYTGATDVTAGRLDVAGTLTSNVTVATGAAVGGEGSISTGSSLSFATGLSALGFDPSTPSVGLTVPTVNTAVGTTVLVSPDGPVIASTDYLVLTNSAGFSGSPSAIFKSAVRGTLAYTNLNTELHFTAGTLDSLEWRGNDGTSPTLWNIDTTSNWDNDGSPDRFFNQDSVTFNDSAVGTTIEISGTDVAPQAVTFSHSTKNFTLSSAGGFGISAGGLTKTGTGSLTINNSNSYPDGTLLANGTITISSATSLGSSAGTLTIDSTGESGTPVPTLRLGATIASTSRNIVLTTDGTFDTNAFDLTQGGVVSGDGAFVKTGAGTLSLTNTNTFTGGVVVKGGTLSVNADNRLGADPGSPTPGNITLDGGTLSLNFGNGSTIANRGVTLGSGGGTLTAAAGNYALAGIIDGPGSLTIANTTAGALYLAGAQHTYQGGAILNPGSTSVAQVSSVGTPPSLDSGPFGKGTLTLAGGAIRGTTGGLVTIGNAISFAADTTIPDSGGLAMDFSGAVTLTGSRTLTQSEVGSTITISGAIGDGGGGYGLTKSGNGVLALTNTSTYSGATTVNAGTLALGSSGSIASTTLTVAAGAKLDTTAKTTFALPATVSIGLNGTAGTSGLIDATGQVLDIDGAAVTFNVTGTLSAPSYLIAKYSSISGAAAFASVTPPAGYAVDYTTTPGQIKLVKSGFSSWIGGFGLAVADQDPGDDPDSDGLENVLEYVLNGNPAVSGPASILPLLDASGSNFVFTFTRREESKDDTTQIFEYGANLSSWTPVNITAPTGTEVSLGTPSAGLQTVQIIIPKSPASVDGKLFGRLKVVK